MLYAVLLSVVCATLVAGVVRLAGISATDQARREKQFRARAFADEQLAVLKSQGKAGSLTVPGTLTRTGTGLTLTGSYVASPTLAGVVNVEQTVRVGGMNHFFRDFVAVPGATTRFSFATLTYGADSLLNGIAGAAGAANAPDWSTASLDASTSPTASTTLACSGFFSTADVGGAAKVALLAELGMTSQQFAAYDLIAFSVSNSTNPTFTTTTWEFFKRNLRLRVTGNGTGTLHRNVSLGTYQAMFDLGASPLSGTTSIRAILFDFDVMPGGVAFRSDSNQLRTFIYTTSGATAPRIDALARLEDEEYSPVTGAFIEAGNRISDNGPGAMSSIRARGVIPFPDSTNSASMDVPIGTIAGNNFARYTGNLVPPSTGNYQFRVTADDGVRLWVNGVNRISSWRNQTPAVLTSAAVPLTANSQVPICFEWYDSGDQEARKVEWMLPSGVWEVIPDEAVRPTAGTEPVGRGYWSFNDDDSSGFTWTGIRTSGGGPAGQPNANGIAGGQYLGDFGGDGAPGPTFTANNISAGRIVVTFEANIAGSWESSSPHGPDYVQLLANGMQIMQVLGTDTGNYELSTTMPLASLNANGNWLILRSEFVHPGGTLTLKWQKSSPSNANGINQESFMLDNITIRRFR